MRCVNIDHIEFDQASRLALSDIHRRLKLFKYLKASMIGGTLMVILSGRNLKSIHTNIKTTDFQALSQALSGIANAQKKELHRIAVEQVISRAANSANKSFWEGIASGCNI